MRQPSFSSEVKEELYEKLPGARHCQLAELSAIGSFSGLEVRKNTAAEDNEGDPRLGRKYFTLCTKTSTISKYDIGDDAYLWQECCKRAYLRGAFLAAGSVNDPNKTYHFEIVCPNAETAGRLENVIRGLGLTSGTTIRKGASVVYIKEADSIVTALGMMGANRAVLVFEDARVLKDMRGQINRKVNCETANIGKTVGAGLKQIEAITKIEESIGLSSLPEGLSELAALRLDNPDLSLAALGELMDPPLGKSGVNHRLRRIISIAEEL
ncbi:MAG: DNA-binding protein WhiA [Lachnospiraceae bacterium]|nr:DNA-binding protein WhiA [Lachnospiraceae bacterium]